MEKDLTTGNPLKLLIIFSIPLLIGNLFQQFYNIADILARYGAKEDIRNMKGLTPWDCIENNIE